jgi:hypothetical protein
VNLNKLPHNQSMSEYDAVFQQINTQRHMAGCFNIPLCNKRNCSENLVLRW